MKKLLLSILLPIFSVATIWTMDALHDQLNQAEQQINELETEFQVHQEQDQPTQTLSTQRVCKKLLQGTSIFVFVNILGDVIKNGNRSYLAQLRTGLCTPELAKKSCTAGLIAGTVFAIGSYPDQSKKVLLTLGKGAIKAYASGKVVVDVGIDLLKEIVAHKEQVAITTTMLLALTGLNYLTRTDRSLIAHLQQHGHKGIIPCIGDQCAASTKYLLELFSKQSTK